MRKFWLLLSVLMLIGLGIFAPASNAEAASKYKLTADVVHDNEIYRLRGYWLGKYDGKKLISQRKISKADWQTLFENAKDFLALPKSEYRDPDLGDDGEGKSTVEVTVARLGKVKTISYESGDAPGSVDDAPVPFKSIAEKIRDLAGD